MPDYTPKLIKPSYLRTVFPEHYHQLASTLGVVWVGEYTGNTNKKTRWRCSCGTEWHTSYANLAKSQTACCKQCSYGKRGLSRRLMAEDYYALAQARGFEWLGTEVPNARTKTKWRCFLGHEWDAVHYAIKKGNGCPVCFEQRRGTLHLTEHDAYIALAHERGFQFLGIVRTATKLKGRWQCPEGHEWVATHAKILSGQGCPTCATEHRNDNRIILEDKYHALAARRDFEWVGAHPGSTSRKTRWRCIKKHEWDATYAHIANGRGCPKCIDFENGSATSGRQRELHALTGGEINYRVGKYTLDIALTVNGINIDIEYDCWFWHQDKKQHDANRDAYLQHHHWRILRVRTNDSMPTREQLDAAISELVGGAAYTEIVMDDWRGYNAA